MTGIQVPENLTGQFNLIGYSYGSLIAAQSAIYHADKGLYVDNLVLIGSPISSDFLEQLQSNPNIGNVIVMDLGFNGDSIHAGETFGSTILGAPTLIHDFYNTSDTTGAGHFYYAPPDEVGQNRRRDLANELYNSGLR